MGSSAKSIGGFFQRHRLEAKIELQQASDYLELDSVHYLVEYEAGQELIPLNHIFALANLYDISPDEIVVLLYDLTCAAKAQKGAKISNEK